MFFWRSKSEVSRRISAIPFLPQASIKESIWALLSLEVKRRKYLPTSKSNPILFLHFCSYRVRKLELKSPRLKALVIVSVALPSQVKLLLDSLNHFPAISFLSRQDSR